MRDRGDTRHVRLSRHGVPRIAIGLLALVAVVGLLCLWINHRGQDKWVKYKQELEARGETLDWLAYLPPSPPPDEENFAATPLLKAVGVKGMVNTAVWGRFQALRLDSQLGRTGDWMNGRRAELTSIQRFLRSNAYSSLAPLPQTPAADVLATLKAVQPEFDELRAASKRPHAKLRLNYPDPVSADIPNFISFRALAQMLSLSASAELALGKTDEAFADVRVIHRLGDAVKPEPFLVSAMIGVALRGLELQAFWEGWCDGRWTEPQLQEFQNGFAAVDLLSMVDRAMRGERAGVTQIVEKSTSQKLAQTLGSSMRGWSSSWWKDRLTDYGIRFSPRGLRYENLLNYCRGWDRSVLSHYNVEQHRIFANELKSVASSIVTVRSRDLPFHYLGLCALPNTHRAIESVARNQTALNQALLVCALERYRRAHRDYPASLQDLLPDFIQTLPHDLITGQPLHYRRTNDGKFILYSVGWNEKDDEGLPGKEKGDWVWPVVATESD